VTEHRLPPGAAPPSLAPPAPGGRRRLPARLRRRAALAGMAGMLAIGGVGGVAADLGIGQDDTAAAGVLQEDPDGIGDADDEAGEHA
jgi:hypothetical protein